MDAAELDVALDELETRLERLRALYEQYFMGIERIEPTIARKDVDRRIYVLRREKIRNTAKRFKLQTIIQRYNTFQQYWQRICREIENGTYKRHLLRAQKNGDLLTIAARKRLGRQARSSQPPAEASPSQPPAADAPSVAAPASLPPAAPPPATAPSPAPPAPSSPPAPLAALAALPRRPPLPVRPGTAPPQVAASAASPSPVPPRPVEPPRPAPRTPPPAKFESLDLDMDFMGGWDPTATRDARPKPPASPPAKPIPPRAAPAAPKPAPPAAPIARAPVASPPAPAPKAAPSALPAAVAPAPAVKPTPAAAAPAAAKPAPAPTAPPAPVAKPAPAPVAKPAPAPVAKPAPAPVAKPAPAPVAKPAPAAAKPAPAAAKPAGAAPSSPEDTRLRELHARLQQAKQQTNEPKVSFEGMAKSVRAAEAKLREQHKDRKIEFDVVIKDGKAIVKPILR